MLDKIFSWRKKKQIARPGIQIGRYSDNNKSQEKTELWTKAENLFKEKKYYESITAFFEYLKDDDINNVAFERSGTHFKFEIYQGSKVLRGSGNAKHMHAKVILAKMPQPSVPVMRRLLEHNYTLFYSRYSLNHERLCMQFDTDIDSANPNKLYYALKELAIISDKQDDLLVQDFHVVEKLDTDHIEEIPAEEKETRYQFMQKWISENLEAIKGLDQEKYAGGIAYMLLALIYRIDYLVTPQGGLMHELETIQFIYFKKDDKPNVEKNRLMMAGIEKFQQRSKEEVFSNLFRTTSTFSIRTPKPYSNIADSITTANKSMVWYRDNKHTEIARQIMEYGISFSQYSFSLPRPVSEYFQLFMEVNYADYFKALGFLEEYYIPEGNIFKREEIEDALNTITNNWKKKYKQLNFRTSKLKFDNIISFNESFTTELAELNLDTP